MRIAALAAAATLAASLIAAPPLRAATRPPAPASVAPATTVQAAQAEVLATQDLIDAASATLAQVRNELFIAADPGTIASLDLQQSRLQVRKTVLIARLAIQQRRLNQLIAQQASLEARNASLALNASTAPPVLAGAQRRQSAGARPDRRDDRRLPAGPSEPPDRPRGGVRRRRGIGRRRSAGARGDQRRRDLVRDLRPCTGRSTIRSASGRTCAFRTGARRSLAAADTLGGNLYRGAGLVTIPEIQSRWAPLGVANDPLNLNSNWVANVSRYYADLGGNPNGAVIAAGPTQLVSLTPSVPPPGTEGPAAAKTALGLLGVPNSADSPDGLNDVQFVQTVYQDQGVVPARHADRALPARAPPRRSTACGPAMPCSSPMPPARSITSASTSAAASSSTRRDPAGW